MEDIKGIKFNIFHRQTTREGDPCDVKALGEIDLSAIDPSRKDAAPLIQTFDCGHRIAKGNIDGYSSWNLTTFTDLDWKKYKQNGEYYFAKPDEQDKTKWIWVSEKRKKEFYQMYHIFVDEMFFRFGECVWAQQSFSECSFHLICKFDCEKNETNFKKASMCASAMCRAVAKVLGKEYADIINSPDVLDECTMHAGQGIYLTQYDPLWNEYPEHTNEPINLDDIHLEEEEFEQTEVVFGSDRKYKAKTKLAELPGGYSYTNTRRLMWVVFKYFDFDKDKCKDVWSRVIPEILSRRGKEKTEKELWKEYNEAYRNHKGKNYPFKGEILDWARNNLGFKFDVIREFKPMAIETYKPDAEYTLKEGQSLSDIDIEWSHDKINHLFAGCGLGKTYMGKRYGEAVSNESDIEWLLNNRFFKKGVCFVTPMKSINRDSFKGVDGWVIIDTDSKEENLYQYDTIKHCIERNQNICTTWESFVLHGMYKLPFDYVIVDEVHTWYMYDYRLESISEIKRCLPQSSAVKILMTGTPSYETQEFDCYKIKVTREAPKVKTDMVFYHRDYMGYVIQDIKEWIADKDHYALVFKDRANYKDEENWKRYYGLEVDMFNSRYDENVNIILNEHTVKSQITMFSVYGQAGINLYMDGRKTRIYIINTTGLGIIQYANRVRDKECIDKVVIPVRIQDIKNTYRAIGERDIEKATRYLGHRVDVLNAMRNPISLYDALIVKDQDVLKLRYGVPGECLGRLGDKLTLNERVADAYVKILCVMKHERQTQVIYNRLKENSFDVNLVYLDKDVKNTRNTTLQGGNFAGKMVRFNWDVVKRNKNGSYWIDKDVDVGMKKIFTGDLEELLEEIFNYLSMDPFCNGFDEMKETFGRFINAYVKLNGTVTKSNLRDVRDMLRYNHEWDSMYNNAIVYVMVMGNMDDCMITAAYMRTKYKEGIEWNDYTNLCDEAYKEIHRLRGTFEMFKDMFIDKKVNKLDIANDDITKMTYSYLLKKHSSNRSISGRKGGSKGKKISVEGVEYDSVSAAAEALGISRKTLYKWKEQGKLEEV